MNDQVKFKRLQELAQSLAQGLDALKSGRLSVDELEDLTEHSRELYERLVVLRFKAYDAHSKVQSTPEIEEETSPFAVPFKIQTPPPAPITPNQVNLIDAIEEVTKEETTAATPAPTPTPTPTPAPTPTSSSTPTINSTVNQHAAESLNDRLSKAVGAVNTLAQKLESTPIQDLKRAITLNQRFQFSRELFKGNNQDYEVAIDKLNSTTRDEALKQLDQLKNKYAWNNDAQVTLDFIELIERRYQS